MESDGGTFDKTPFPLAIVCFCRLESPMVSSVIRVYRKHVLIIRELVANRILTARFRSRLRSIIFVLCSEKTEISVKKRKGCFLWAAAYSSGEDSQKGQHDSVGWDECQGRLQHHLALDMRREGVVRVTVTTMVKGLCTSFFSTHWRHTTRLVTGPATKSAWI